MHAPPEVPPATWIDDMRTPPLETVLSQFRAQKVGPPATADAATAPADAAAPPEPAAASDAATTAEEPAETPRSGVLQFTFLILTCHGCSAAEPSLLLLLMAWGKLSRASPHAG